MVQTLFEFAPYAMVLVNQAGQIVLVNAQLEFLFGYQRQELTAKPIELLLPACLQSWYADPPTSLLNAPGQTCQAELQGKHKDASEFPLEIKFTSLQADHQLLMAIFEIGHHKRKAAESAELQHRLHDRRLAEGMALAQKLHNEPLQDLQILNFTLASLAGTLEAAFDLTPATLSIPTLLAQVLQIRESIGRVSRQLRTLHQELYPPSLTAFGLATAIQSYVKGIQADDPTLEIELALTEDDKLLSTPLRAALYHVCQQALKNIGQHAHARLVEIRLQRAAEQIVLEIIDDGCGFDVPEDWITIGRQGRLGLSSAQERVEAAGGRFYIRSAPDRGTTISVIAPIKSTN